MRRASNFNLNCGVGQLLPVYPGVAEALAGTPARL
jgi:hypothetical protein